MRKKVIAYFFKSESCDYYLNIDIVDENTKPLNVVEAMDKFGWDGGIENWMRYCKCNTKEELLEELPYAEFMTKEKIVE